MKQIILGVVLSFILVSTIAITLTIFGDSSLDVRLSNSLMTSLSQSMSELVYNDELELESEDELCAIILQHLLTNMSSDEVFDELEDYKLTVDIVSVDIEKGLIYAKAELDYKAVNGKKKKISKESGAILERQMQNKVYTIEFVVDGNIYHSVGLEEGSSVVFPDISEIDGRYTRWINESDGSEASGDELVTGDLRFAAG